MITLSGVGRSHGQRVLFRDVSLQILPSHRMAIVGPNGAGKTTLLEIIAGTHPPDTGEVIRARGVEVGFLRQEVAETAGRSVLDEVMAGAGHVTGLDERLRELEAQIAASEAGAAQDALLAEYGHAQHRFEHLGGYTLESDARRVLAGLGFDEGVVEHDVGELSGGWMMRVALARLLLAEPDVLLLDEPTNHLDLASVTWLEGFLAAYTGAIVLVSHDRDFINAVANRVIEISRGTTTEYVGDYAAFVEQRELRQSQLVAASRNQQRKIEQTERFIERFRYKNTKAKQVQSRIKSLEKLERVEVQPRSTKTMRFKLPPPPRAGREVVKLEGVVKRYGDKLVYDGLDFVLEREHKVALVGPNGAGKSTLLKILAGVLPFEAGTRTLGHNVEVAYYAQHQIDALHLDRTVLQELASGVDTAKVNPRSILGAFMFPGDDVDKRVDVLSGGEKARLALAKLLARPVNLLCMDEPTNHLDIGSRDVVEDALLEYPGTVVLITHDRHLIRSVADTIVEVRDGSVTVHPGTYEDYEWRTGGGLDGRVATPAPTPRVAPARPSDDERAARKRAEAEARNRRHRETRDLRKRLREVEVALGSAEADIAELTRHLADPATYDDGERVKSLVAQHGAAKDRAVELTREWERLFEQVERDTANASG